MYKAILDAYEKVDYDYLSQDYKDAVWVSSTKKETTKTNTKTVYTARKRK